MSRALDSLNRNMLTPEGVRFSATALSFSHVDDDTLRQAGAWLQRVEGCRAWWWGDFLCAYCEHEMSKRRRAPNEYLTPDDSEREYIHYTSRYAQAAGVDPETMKHWRAVAAFFKPQQRHENLSWTHHAEAVFTLKGDRASALRWLEKAAANGWSVSQLRAAIRLERERATGDHEPRPALTVQDVLACARWAQARLKHLDEIDDTTAKQLLREFAPIEKLIASLRARIAEEVIA